MQRGIVGHGNKKGVGVGVRHKRNAATNVNVFQVS